MTVDHVTPLVPIAGGIGAVPGIRLAGVRAGIKVTAPAEKLDLALLVFDEPQVAAAQVTTNEIKAAPVIVSAEHLAQSSGQVRALVANSGCANACTGARGIADAHATAEAVAKAIGAPPASVLVASTGVIGVALPIDRLIQGVQQAAQHLQSGGEAGERAARAIMTTDTREKLRAYQTIVDGKTYTVGGIAKGSGMIAPTLATMLAFVATDYPMSQAAIDAALRDATQDTFNMISVDGDMSTNDALYAFAPVGTAERAPLAILTALRQVCRDLAIAIVEDGEGATKRLTLNVTGAASAEQARIVARAVVDSNLVRTALHGGDPNWGRIIAAAGSKGAGLVDGAWSLRIEGHPWVGHDAVERLSESDAHGLIARQHVTIDLDLGLGDATATAWGCDLSHAYVDINAHYRT